jgi:hypothetical protein
MGCGGGRRKFFSSFRRKCSDRAEYQVLVSSKLFAGPKFPKGSLTKRVSCW